MKKETKKERNKGHWVNRGEHNTASHLTLQPGHPCHDRLYPWTVRQLSLSWGCFSQVFCQEYSITVHNLIGQQWLVIAGMTVEGHSPGSVSSISAYGSDSVGDSVFSLLLILSSHLRLAATYQDDSNIIDSPWFLFTLTMPEATRQTLMGAGSAEGRNSDLVFC